MTVASIWLKTTFYIVHLCLVFQTVEVQNPKHDCVQLPCCKHDTWTQWDNTWMLWEWLLCEFMLFNLLGFYRTASCYWGDAAFSLQECSNSQGFPWLAERCSVPRHVMVMRISAWVTGCFDSRSVQEVRRQVINTLQPSIETYDYRWYIDDTRDVFDGL